MQSLLALLLLGSPQEPEPYSVFLLAGQSNMEGQAVVDLDHAEHYNGGRGTLNKLFEKEEWAPKLAHLRDEEGWVERDDVLVWYRRGNEQELRAGKLSIGYAVYGGLHHFGPELQFGHLLGDHCDEPVLLVKTCWGGKSLFADFRPPSADGDTGPYYERMLAQYAEALADAPQRFEALKGRQPVLRGFVWFQGWNDMVSEEATAEYADNLAHLIRDVRKALRAPALPVVVGETGNCNHMKFRGAQREGASREEGVTFVETAAFLRPAEEGPNTGHGHHWFGNAGSYFLIGDAFGRAMIALLEG